MKEFFIAKKFGSEAVSMIATVNTILDDYRAQGYDLSLRQLYYQLVARNLVPNTERSYKNVGNLVSDARLAGLIDWSMIRDRGRNTVTNTHWNSPGDIVRAAANQFRIDRWTDQPNYVEVMVEKQALEGVLEPVCEELDVPFTANKGYSSSSAMYVASKRFLRAKAANKECYVIYLGDHDPSGIDMTRDVDDRLATFMGGVEVQRVALNMYQVVELQPPENPAKVTDSRAAGYISRFGHSSWELDAIEPSQLADIVRRAVQKLIDYDLWDEREKIEETMKSELIKFSDTYGKGKK
jgi:hypothetical protein